MAHEPLRLSKRAKVPAFVDSERVDSEFSPVACDIRGNKGRLRVSGVWLPCEAGKTSIISAGSVWVIVALEGMHLMMEERFCCVRPNLNPMCK